MQQSRGSMGSHKHGTSGHTTRNTRTKVLDSIAANKLAETERLKKPQAKFYSSMEELMNKETSRRHK